METQATRYIKRDRSLVISILFMYMKLENLKKSNFF